jgi:hypothetical protein
MVGDTTTGCLFVFGFCLVAPKNINIFRKTAGKTAAPAVLVVLSSDGRCDKISLPSGLPTTWISMNWLIGS